MLILIFSPVYLFMRHPLELRTLFSDCTQGHVLDHYKGAYSIKHCLEMCKSNITDCRWISHRNGLCLFLTHCTDVEVGNSPEFTSAMVDCGDAQHSEFDILLSFYRLLDIDFSKWPLNVNFIVFTNNIFS